MRNSLKYIYLYCRKLFLRIIKKRNKSPFPQKKNKILLIMPPRVGDVSLVLPALVSLKDAHPEYEIHVCTNDYTKELISLSIPDIQIHRFGKGIIKHYNMIKSLRNYGFHISIDLNFDYHIKTAIIASFTGRYSIGYENAGRGHLFNMSLPEPDSLKHASDIFSKPLTFVFKDLHSFQKDIIKIPEDLEKHTQDRLNRIGLSPNDKVVLIHPGCHHETQRWPPDYFSETADKVIETGKVKLIFVGGVKEKNLIHQIISLMSSEPSGIFTNMNIKNLVGLIHRANLMICNNSGPLHIAVITNTPTISTMGPTLKERWVPLGKSHKVLRMDELPCIGCNKGYCLIKTHDCMRKITPSLMFKEVNKYLNSINLEFPPIVDRLT